MSERITVRRVWLATLAVGFLVYALALWLVVAPKLGLYIALRGLYPIVGGAVALSLYLGMKGGSTSERGEPHLSTAQFEKVAVIVTLYYVAVLVTFEPRWVPLLLVLPVLTYAIVRAVVDNHYWRALRLSVLLLTTPAAAKVIANDYYVGSVDRLKDLPETAALLQLGSFQALPGWYSYFPGTYVLTGFTSSVTNIELYTTYHTISVLIFSLLPLVVFYTLSGVIDRRTAIAGSLTVSFLSPIAYFATQFYPASQVLVYFAFAVLVASNLSGANWRWPVLATLFVVAITFTHHLSVIYLIGILIGIVILKKALERYDQKEGIRVEYILEFLLVGAIGYWINTRGGLWFTESLITAVVAVVGRLFSRSPRASTTANSLNISGVEVFHGGEPRTVGDAFLWLITPDGVVNIFLVAIILLSLTGIYRDWPLRTKWLAMPVAGMFSLVVVLKTPLTFLGIHRGRLFLSFVGLFFLTYGVRYLLNTAEHRGTVSLPVIALVVLAVATPLSAADDVNSLRPDADELTEKAYTDRELAEMDAAGRFAGDSIDEEIVTAHRTRIYLESRFLGLRMGKVKNLLNGRCRDAYFMYRMSWSRYQITMSQEGSAVRGQQYLTSERRLDDMATNSDKVYSNGGAGFARVHDCEVGEEHSPGGI